MLEIAPEKSPTLYSIAIFVIHSCFTDIFFPLKINLLDGLPSVFYKETCTAGAGTMLLEFGILSRLLGDPVFENLARKAVAALWKHRSRETGLLGNVINVETGDWTGKMSGLGAGLDSFYEYLLKVQIEILIYSIHCSC